MVDSTSCIIYTCSEQGRIQDLVLGGTKFGKVIWEYYFYCLICLWNVSWCRKIKIDLQVITIIWGEETEPHSLFSFFSIYFLMFIWDFLGFFGGGVNIPSTPSESASGESTYSDQNLLIQKLFLKKRRY